MDYYDSTIILVELYSTVFPLIMGCNVHLCGLNLTIIPWKILLYPSQMLHVGNIYLDSGPYWGKWRYIPAPWSIWASFWTHESRCISSSRRRSNSSSCSSSRCRWPMVGTLESGWPKTWMKNGWYALSRNTTPKLLYVSFGLHQIGTLIYPGCWFGTFFIFPSIGIFIDDP